MYILGWNWSGPWDKIAEKVRIDLEETGAMKEKIENLLEKQKEQTMVYLTLKKEKDDLYVIN